MYTITKCLDGKFFCECIIQDGTERWLKQDIDEAVNSMKRAAEILNGAKIKKRDISFRQQREILETTIEYIPWIP